MTEKDLYACVPMDMSDDDIYQNARRTILRDFPIWGMPEHSKNVVVRPRGSDCARTRLRSDTCPRPFGSPSADTSVSDRRKDTKWPWVQANLAETWEQIQKANSLREAP
jgi:hypothetical protein